jgi:hypothetical protein
MNDEGELEELQHNNAYKEDIRNIAKKHAEDLDLSLKVQLETNGVNS